jgi:two-component system, cell cycle response regulator DivK
MPPGIIKITHRSRNLELLLDGVQSAMRKLPMILAVDDHEDNLLLLMEILAPMACTFIAAADGKSAITLAQNYLPDLILLDIMLPDCSGIEVVHRLKQDSTTNQIPIIAVTALVREVDRTRLLFAGCNDYICKPYVLEELEAVIFHHLPTLAR